MYTIRPANKLNTEEISQILLLWKTSVRATHHFLPEKMVIALRPLVHEAFLAIEHLLVLVDEYGHIQGFSGIEGDRLEMLFLAPDHFKQGLGKMLILHAISCFDIQYVDVNEQNPDATQFYQHIGFEIIGRSETDGQGNPFPILHLKLTKPL